MTQLLKQVQTKHHHKPPQQHKHAIRNQSRTRTLSGLKSSLITGNQANILPPRPVSMNRQSRLKMVDDQTLEKERDEIDHIAFRRNLSLPFKQPRQQVLD